MRRLLLSLILLGGLLSVPSAFASGKIIKVLPLFLDLKGQHATSPSLYDRDAYQAWLRNHPEARSGILYDVQWKAREVKGQLKLRVELRGVAKGEVPRKKTIEKVVKPSRGMSRWSGVSLTGEDYKKFGDVTAWRVTLWDGDNQLAEQASFLW